MIEPNRIKAMVPTSVRSVLRNRLVAPVRFWAGYDGPYADMLGGNTLDTVLRHCRFETVLDVGSGAGRHADIMAEDGRQVTAIDFGVSIYYQRRGPNRTDIIGDYYQYNFDQPFDCVWACHVLEHQPNPNEFLKKIHRDLREDGWLAITVPPLKHEIVGGHLSLWNAGLLLYHLVFAGFDCRQASVRTQGYNVSVVVRKRTIENLPELHYDSGDIERLSAYFPDIMSERCDGRIRRHRWPPS